VFAGCASLAGIAIPDGVVSIGPSAFSASGLFGVSLPNSVTSVGSNAFANCGALGGAKIPGSVTNFGGFAFYDCFSLTNVVLANGLANIGDFAFSGCDNLSGIIIPGGVTNIGQHAFDGCSRLAVAVVGSGLVSIGPGAFQDCWRLGTLYFAGDAPAVDSTALFSDGVAAVKYLPGTAGWSATFGGRPASLWLPEIQARDGGFGFQDGQFGFNVAWADGETVVVEASAGVGRFSWQPLQTNALSGGMFYFGDPQWTNYPGRFYRVRRAQ
jgi:hypothetical protein